VKVEECRKISNQSLMKVVSEVSEERNKEKRNRDFYPRLKLFEKLIDDPDIIRSSLKV